MQTAKTLIRLGSVKLRWVHRPFCCFCHVATHFIVLRSCVFDLFSISYNSQVSMLNPYSIKISALQHGILVQRIKW